MLLKTILNRAEPHQSFVYSRVRLIDSGSGPTLEIDIQPRANSRPICSGCGHKGSGYDRLPMRRFEFIPLWGIAAFFLYAMRRVDCPRCGITVERVLWADGKNHLTTTYQWFLARWSKRLSWRGVAQVFHTTWENVFRSVRMAVQWGLKHRDPSGIVAALPEGDRQEGGPGDPHPGSVPHYGQDEPGHRRRTGRRGQTAKAEG